MGRAERRAYNKKHGTKLTREEFDCLVAVARIQAGNYNFSDLKVPSGFAHMDNFDLVPEGCPCKLNYEEIKKRPNADKNPGFLEWVDEHKDMILHVTRENAVESLICFKEDERYTTDPETGAQTRVPPWLFDTYADILIQAADGTYKTVAEVETEQNKTEASEEVNQVTENENKN